MKRALLTVLIILAIILLIILLLRFFRKKNSSDSGGKHEKAEHFSEARNTSPKTNENRRKVPVKSGSAASGDKHREESMKSVRKVDENVQPISKESSSETPFDIKKSKEYEMFFASEEKPSEKETATKEASFVNVREAEGVPAEKASDSEEISAATENEYEKVLSTKEPQTEQNLSETEQPSTAPVKSGFSLNSAVQKDSTLKSLNRFSRVIAINIETPNNEHDSICNIGITVGDTEKCLSTNVTVNPEEPIDDVPDGMTEEEILNSPTLKELWPGMSRLLSGSLVIAHNSAYDLTILKKALKAYGLEVPEFYQACTYRMSRKFHPEFDSYKLGSICETYQIPLDVKNAVSHSDACFDIFCRLAEEGKPVFEEAKLFSLD